MVRRIPSHCSLSSSASRSVPCLLAAVDRLVSPVQQTPHNGRRRARDSAVDPTPPPELDRLAHAVLRAWKKGRIADRSSSSIPQCLTCQTHPLVAIASASMASRSIATMPFCESSRPLPAPHARQSPKAPC